VHLPGAWERSSDNHLSVDKVAGTTGGSSRACNIRTDSEDVARLEQEKAELQRKNGQLRKALDEAEAADV
jgi:hypothetical protein